MPAPLLIGAGIGLIIGPAIAAAVVWKLDSQSGVATQTIRKTILVMWLGVVLSLAGIVFYIQALNGGTLWLISGGRSDIELMQSWGVARDNIALLALGKFIALLLQALAIGLVLRPLYLALFRRLQIDPAPQRATLSTLLWIGIMMLATAIGCVQLAVQQK
ncbi:hypothetical protein EON80_17360 [bacterium]|nr:MAG: hypothetical protein EON80_17360 [bacterium]